MSTVYYDNINGFSQLKMENSRLYGRLNSGDWTEIETGGEPGEPGADGQSAYVYIAWCSDPSTGAGFSLTTPADYIAFLSTNTQLVSPQFIQFSGWTKYVGDDGTDGTSTYVYYAYASDASGTNFALSPADGLNYQAILVTHTELVSPSLADFVGLFYQYKTDLSAYLPLAGGTMTGTIETTNTTNTITSANERIIMSGGSTYLKGGNLRLYGDGYDGTMAGGAALVTFANETQQAALLLTPDGKGIWNDADLSCITASDLTRAAGYIRYSNGFQLCWGITSSMTAGENNTVNFSVAFNENPKVFLTRGSGATTSSNGYWWVRGASTTNFLLYTTTTASFFWYAIGTWK